MAWKATIRYEARDSMGLEIIVEEVVEGETVDCQLWAAHEDVMWIGSGKKTLLIPIGRLVSIVKEKQ